MTPGLGSRWALALASLLLAAPEARAAPVVVTASVPYAEESRTPRPGTGHDTGHGTGHGTGDSAGHGTRHSAGHSQGPAGPPTPASAATSGPGTPHDPLRMRDALEAPAVLDSAGAPREPVTPSLAGRPAGAGRERPGRPSSPPPTTDPASAGPSASATPSPSRTKTATADPERLEAERDPRAVPEEDSSADVGAPPTGPAAAYEPAAQGDETPADRQVPVLTLGFGLALMGLGVGFLGLRMRRR
ncbi:hypothetical protein [Streptomyces sp. SP18CS02]|uniref:hypothetical protein n=1 Tax=Streptomyces sp. SP18CS02 TaxID=3002531 RepID=UPI002E7A1DBB|nr:hypothetical protein [Streptomyces sp. SP18CS02]MEE1754427.1 hypothetical protein [Streptomyces sp. SP18CS02]